MKLGASEKGPATDQVRSGGGSYQAGDNADEEKLMDLGGVLEVKPIEPVTIRNGWEPEMIPALLPLDAKVITKVGETARETYKRKIIFIWEW